MTQANPADTRIGDLLCARPDVALGAVGMLAVGTAAAVGAGSSATSVALAAGLADPAVAAFAALVVGTTALLTFLTTRRFVLLWRAETDAAS